MDENNKEQSELERIGRHLAPVMPSNAWLLIYLGKEGKGPIKTVSVLPEEMQQDLARAVAHSFKEQQAKRVMRVAIVNPLGEPIGPLSDEGCARAHLDHFLDKLLTMGRDSATVTELGPHPSREGRWEFAVQVLGKTLRVDMPATAALPTLVGLNRIYVPWADAVDAAVATLTK